MDVGRIRDILKTEYGICNNEEFEAAVKRSAGINIGIFTTPLPGRRDLSELENKEKVTA